MTTTTISLLDERLNAYRFKCSSAKEVDPPDPSKKSRRCLSEASDQRGFEARRPCSPSSKFQFRTRPQQPTSPERLGKDMEGGQQHMAHQQPQESGLIATGE
ncbi:unnamed protein product [Caenorhabditis brenneri]